MMEWLIKSRKYGMANIDLAYLYLWGNVVLFDCLYLFQDDKTSRNADGLADQAGLN